MFLLLYTVSYRVYRVKLPLYIVVDISLAYFAV